MSIVYDTPSFLSAQLWHTFSLVIKKGYTSLLSHRKSEACVLLCASPTPLQWCCRCCLVEFSDWRRCRACSPACLLYSFVCQSFFFFFKVFQPQDLESPHASEEVCVGVPICILRSSAAHPPSSVALCPASIRGRGDERLGWGARAARISYWIWHRRIQKHSQWRANSTWKQDQTNGKF